MPTGKAPPITVGRTTAPAKPNTQRIAESLRGTGALDASIATFAAGTYITPVKSFGFSVNKQVIAFVLNQPRVVSAALLTQLTALNGSPVKAS
jgi:hypothetical protein